MMMMRLQQLGLSRELHSSDGLTTCLSSTLASLYFSISQGGGTGDQKLGILREL